MIPTAITDRNGKQTTVHKKGASSPSASLGKLAGLAPKLPSSSPAAGASHPDDKKMVKVAFSVAEKNAYKSLTKAATGVGTLIAELGAFDKVNDKYSVSISRGELFDYLKLGVTVQEAALLSTKGSFDDWKNNPRFADATPASLAWIKRKDGHDVAEIGRTVDALRAHGVTPKKAQSLLASGMQDKHLDGTLDLDQLTAVFGRFEYSPSTIRGQVTEYERTIDGLIDGLIPFENFEAGYTRTSIRDVLNELYPENRKYGKNKLTEEEAEDLKQNPYKISQVISVSEQAGRKDLAAAYRAVKLFGFDTAKEYGLELLMTQREDGSVIGVEGAKRVQSTFAYIRNNIPEGYKPPAKEPDEKSDWIYLSKEGTYRDPFKLTASEATKILDAGGTPEIIAHYAGHGLNPEQIHAVVSKNSSPTLVSGWL